MLFRDGKFLAYMNITISPRKDVLFELVSIQIYSGNNHGDDNIDVCNQCDFRRQIKKRQKKKR